MRNGIEKLHDYFAENTLRFRIRQTPVPASRLEQRFVLRPQIKRRMLGGDAPPLSGMTERGDLRKKRDAEVLSYRDKTPNLGLRHFRVRPAPPRVLLAPVHSPRFDDRIIELEQSCKLRKPQ